MHIRFSKNKNCEHISEKKDRNDLESITNSGILFHLTLECRHFQSNELLVV